MHQQRVAARPEHAEVPHFLHEGFRAEGEPRHRPSPAVRGRNPYRLVHDVRPVGEIGALHAIEAGLGGDRQQLGPPGGDGHRGFERVPERVGIEIHLGGQRRGVGVGGDPGIRIGGTARCIRVQGGLEIPVQLRNHLGRGLAPDQAAVRGAVEDFVDGTQVLADFVRLADYVIEEAEVRIGAPEEVVNGDVARLAVPVKPAVSLLQPGRVPRQVVVEQGAGGAVQVEPLGGGVGGDQHAHP